MAQANSLKITDPILDPFFIKLDNAGYGVYKHFGEKIKKDGTIQQAYDRYLVSQSTLVAACKFIYVKKLVSKNKQVVSLREFIDMHKELSEQFARLTHDNLDKELEELKSRIKYLEGMSKMHEETIKKITSGQSFDF